MNSAYCRISHGIMLGGLIIVKQTSHIIKKAIYLKLNPKSKIHSTVKLLYLRCKWNLIIKLYDIDICNLTHNIHV